MAEFLTDIMSKLTAVAKGLAHHLPCKGRTLKGTVIGHRGLKANRAPGEKVRENTLASIYAGIQADVRWFEFDVQVTKCGVPVIWHDDKLLTLTGDGKKRKHADLEADAADLHTTEINDLLLYEFCSLASGNPVEHRGRVHRLARRFLHSTSKEPQLWVCGAEGATAGDALTLEDALRKVPPDVGFDIELKLLDSRASTPEERKRLIDSTLSILRVHAGSRPLFFSSFDPDCCLEMQAAQDRWPVLLLVADTAPDHADPRRTSLRDAFHAARAADLAGIVAGTDLIVPDGSNRASKEGSQEVIQDILNAGLCLYTYGKHNDSPASIRTQLECGVTAVCTDACHVAVTATQGLELGAPRSPDPSAVPVDVSC